MTPRPPGAAQGIVGDVGGIGRGGLPAQGRRGAESLEVPGDGHLPSEAITDAVQRIEGAEVVCLRDQHRTTPARGQTEQAVADGADLVMAACGDGTVRLVASVLAGTDTRMGIIPAGTGNLLARNVEVPLEDPTAAMVAALTGTRPGGRRGLAAGRRLDGGREGSGAAGLPRDRRVRG